MSRGTNARGTPPKLAGRSWLVIATALALSVGACDKKPDPSPQTKDEKGGPAKAAAPIAGDPKASWDAFARADQVFAECDTIVIEKPDDTARLTAKVQEGLLFLARAVKADPANTLARERFGWEFTQSREFFQRFGQKLDTSITLGDVPAPFAVRICPDSACVLILSKEDVAGDFRIVMRVYDPASEKLFATLNFAPAKAEPAKPTPGAASPADNPPPAASAATPTSTPDNYGLDVLDYVVVNVASQRVVTIQPGGATELWSFASQTPIAQVAGQDHPEMAAFSHDGRQFVTAGKSGTARVWDSADGHELHAFPAGSPLGSAAFTKDGARLVTGGHDGQAMLWDVATQKLTLTIPYAGKIDFLDLSPDGTQVFAESSTDAEPEKNRLFLTDAHTGKLISEAGGETFLDVSFAAPGVVAATMSLPSKEGAAKPGASSHVSLWNMTTGQQVAQLPNKASFKSAWFFPDGSRLATACEDLGVRLWDVGTGHLLGSFWPNTEVRQALVSTDGSRLIAICANSQVKMWDLSLGRALAKSTADPGEYATLASAVSRQRLTDDGRTAPLSADEDKQLLIVLAQLAAKDTPEGHLAKWLLDTHTDPNGGPARPVPSTPPVGK